MGTVAADKASVIVDSSEKSARIYKAKNTILSIKQDLMITSEQGDYHWSALKSIYKDAKKTVILRWIEYLEELQLLGEYKNPLTAFIVQLQKEIKEELHDSTGSKYAYRCYNEIMR
jgi:hypothetical protein